MVQSCLEVLKVFKTSSVECTLHCYLISHLPPKIFLHTYIYYSSLSLSLSHTHTQKLKSTSPNAIPLKNWLEPIGIKEYLHV